MRRRIDYYTAAFFGIKQRTKKHGMRYSHHYKSWWSNIGQWAINNIHDWAGCYKTYTFEEIFDDIR